MPFCGHATVATAIALAERGLVAADEAIRFSTAAGEVSIDVSSDDTGIRAAFTSIDPVVSDLSAADTAAILALLGLDLDALDPDLPPRLSHAGNPHPVVALADRATFDGFVFDPTAARTLLDARGWPATITIIHRTGPDRFAARNIFPVGRITEDPATGSAAASTGAYLRELGAVEVPGRIVIDQGGHVGRPGTLIVDIPAAGGIVVSGYAVRL